MHSSHRLFFALNSRQFLSLLFLSSFSLFLHPLLLFFILSPELFKFFHSFLLLLHFFLTSLLEEHGTFLRTLMLIPIFALYIVLARLTLVCFVATLFSMVDPNFNFKDLLAPLARFGFHFASLFMLSKLCSRRCKWAVLYYSSHMMIS